jgi:hypothetical protein
MPSTNLFSLSTELICLILQSVHSGRDLYAFLQASSLVYRAFTTSKDSILWHLAQSSMFPDVLVLAVTAVKLRNADFALDETEMKFQQVSALAGETLLGGHGTSLLPRELMSSADLTKLRQLQSAVEYFIHEYCSQELPGLFNSSTTPASDLSSTELVRLQRALYRYDICQTIWYGPHRPLDLWHGRAWIAAPALLSRIECWEVDEVACIWQYMRKRLEIIFDRLGQELFESVVAQSDSAQSGGAAELSIKTTAKQKLIAGISRFSEEFDDFIFSEQGSVSQTQLITSLASRQLPFLQKLLEADPDKQQQLIFSHKGFEIDRLEAFLSQSFMLWTIVFQGDKLSACNLGWSWAFEMRSKAFFTPSSSSEIREWGYVFWDEDRLRRSGLIDTPRPRWQKDPFFPRGEYRMAMPSVQQRLEDMNLPEGWDLVPVDAELMDKTGVISSSWDSSLRVN